MHAAPSLPQILEPSLADGEVLRSAEATRIEKRGQWETPRTLPTLFVHGEPAEATLAIREGDIFAGQYRVLARLGVGGMGVVVSARHIELGVPVAIKLLLPHLSGEKDAIAQFAREVLAVAQIENEHVARIFDVGTVEGGAPYMVMEFLEGEDLQAWLHHRGPQPLDQAVDIVLQACEGIAEAHALGIVHRDVKPANLFVTRREDGLCIKVLDFGVSIVKNHTRGAPSDEHSTSRPQAIAGTPLYMSPEQMDAPDDVDGRTDIWALGVCLYELITGLRPFSGRTLPAIRCTIGSETPPPMRDTRPDLPEGIERVVWRCLGKHRRCRYRDIAELASALREFAPPRCWASIERIQRIAESRPRASREVRPERAETMPCAPLSKSRTSIIEAAEGLAARASIQSA